MRPPLENALRNALVQNLELIEQGLRPVQFEEYPLPNAHGTRGSIDILARDRHQMWVVIELKRSRSSARQALHEVNKYTELLCREKNLAPDRIRAVIVAMPDDWEELLIAVSHAARDWSHDLRGYRLLLDSNGIPIGTERVEFLPRAFEPRITPIHNLATPGPDHTVRLWDITDPANPTLKAELADASEPVAFRPDGHTLIVIASNKTIQLRETDAGDATAGICASTAPTLTQAEWNQYLPGRPYQALCP